MDQNQPLSPQQVQPSQPQPVAPQLPLNQNVASNNEIDGSFFSISFVVLMILSTVIILVGVMSPAVSLVRTVLWIAAGIIAYTHVSKIKQLAAPIVTEADKQKAVNAMIFSPLLAQAFYYYRLKKTSPQAASKLLVIGWKILGLSILFYLLLVLVLSAFL